MNAEGEFIRNSWNVIAWSDEVSRNLLGRTVLGTPVVLYRKTSGEVTAIDGVCPHRFAPLAMGTLIGDRVQCGYHGLEFDCSGKCVKNPQSGGQVSDALHIPSYPVTEKHSLVWIWMGEPELAAESPIPDFSHLTDPERRTVKGRSQVGCNYRLLVDNLMDLGHFQYLHGGMAKIEGGFEDVKRNVRQEGTTVYNELLFPRCKPTVLFASAFDDPDTIVDQFNDIRWDPAGVMRNFVGVTRTGAPRELGANSYGTHIVTPETATSCHYFYGASRNYSREDESVDEIFRKWQQRALNEEDKPMIEAIQKVIPLLVKSNRKPVMLTSDAAAVRVERITEKLARSEANQS